LYLKMKKIFVTGGTGFIGSNLIRELLKKNYRVKALTRRCSNLRFISRYDIEIIKGDVRNLEEVENAMKGCDTVIHTAALARDWGRKKDFYDINVEGTENILKASKKNKVEFLIHLSTNAVLGEGDCLKAKDEKSPYNCRYPYFLSGLWESDMNHYRCSKMQAEKASISFCRKNDINLTVLRPVWVYGPREFHSGPYYFCKYISDNLRLLQGCKTNKFHVMYVKDLAKVIIKILKNPKEGVNIYNVGSEYIPTMDEFWRLFCKYLKVKPPVYLPKFLTYPIGIIMEAIYKFLRIKHSPDLTRARVAMGYDSNIYDVSKIHKELEFKETPLEKGVKTTVRWWRRNGFL
jgi:nucleoside-diphosphate-sugar epimerase